MSRQSILVVDDDRTVLESLCDELGERYDVSAAHSGAEAVLALKTRRFDAVISDLRMPDMSGVEVLEEVRRRDHDTLRILLTGFLDDEARHAIMEEDAPFKVAKPWHDNIDVTLMRGFELLEERRRLEESLGDALETSGADDELAGAEGLVGVATVVMRLLQSVHGVTSGSVWLEVPGGGRHTVAEFGALNALRELRRGEWRLDDLLTVDSAAHIEVRGGGTGGKQVAQVLVSRARRWAGEDPAVLLARRASIDSEARNRLMALTRRAALGSMAASVYHEIASVFQGLQISLDDLSLPPVRKLLQADPETQESLDQACELADRAVALFRSLRNFMHSGPPEHRRQDVGELVRQSLAICSSSFRRRVLIDAPAISPVFTDGDGALLIQVLVNLLRNAVDASPPNGMVSITCSADEHQIRISVTDDGDGVPEVVRGHLFEPFRTTKAVGAGTGLGLAFSAQVVREHGGTLTYERCVGRGARFVVTLLRQRELANAA